VAPPASQIEILGFDHVELRVRSREKLRKFFVEQLGLDVLGDGPDHTYLLLGDQVLGLRDAAPDAPGGGIDHVALRVPEWTGLRNRVRRARIVVTREKERDDSRSLFLRAPDGLTVELVWRPEPHEHACRHAEARPSSENSMTEAEEPPAKPSTARRRR
jgi:catechol 2,3-dioxygenase-like lactoylglutathione lyase family enzyme